MLETLGVNGDLKFDVLTDIDKLNLQSLISAVLNGKHLPLEQADRQLYYGLFSIANLKMMLVYRKDEHGDYSVDRFTSDLKVRFTLRNGTSKNKYAYGPAYLIWQAEHYESACNIDSDDILQSIKAYDPTVEYCAIVNNSVLEMLKAYDRQNKQDPLLLKMAEMLCQWLVQYDPDENKEIIKLNHLQVIYRQRHGQLNFAETGFLYSILNDPAKDDFY